MSSNGTPQRAPRVLFLCPELDNGGAERHWASLLPALRDQGIDVRLVGIQGGGRAWEHLQADGIPARALGRSGLRSFLALPALLAERRRKPDVIVTFGYNAHALGGLFARLTGTPQVFNWHRQRGWPMTRAERASVEIPARLGAGAIAVCDAQLDDLHALGVKPERVRVIANGVPAPSEAAEAKNGDPMAGLGLPDGTVRFLLVARLRPEKRVEDFIDAVAQAHHDGSDVHGVVVGDGPDADALRARATSAAAPISFAGFQPDPMRWMLASDVVCLTSTHEALPMSLAEALACSRPCIATSVGSVPEMVHDGVNGVLVPPTRPDLLADAISALAGDPDKRRVMGEKSLQRWRERYDFRAMVTDYANLLSSVRGVPARW